MTELSYYNHNSRNSKYLTIDPLILETLNLNERRMNHILEILHGKNGNQRAAVKAAQNNNDSLLRSYSLQSKKSFNTKISQNNNNMTFDAKSEYNSILPSIN